CTRRRASTSAPGRPRRSRSRSWPRWSASVTRTRCALMLRPRSQSIPFAGWRSRSPRRRRIWMFQADPGTSSGRTAAPPTANSTPPMQPRISGLVLAAGASSRLGQPKQLLQYGSGTLLGHVLDVARAVEFDQLLCVVGGGAHDVLDRVDFTDVEVVHNHAYGEGCSSSIAAALDAVDARSDVLVLMLGDQPGVTASTVLALLAGGRGAPLAACRYADGRGHPLAFGRSMFAQLGSLRGDKGVWKLLDQHPDFVVDVPIAGPVPRDVDTWEDYEAVLAAAGTA